MLLPTTRLRLWFQFKRDNWLKRQEETWAQEYSARKQECDRLLENLQKNGTELQDRIAQVEVKYEEISRIEQLVNDRKTELDSMRQDYKEQIRILEAKASPSHVWESAFSTGFSKAWDMMVPYMTEGLDKLKETIRDNAIGETLRNLDSVIQERARELNGDKIHTD